MVSGHGRGSNLQALIDACVSGEVPGNIELVIGTRKGAPALDRAAAAGVTSIVLKPARSGSDQAYAAALLEALAAHRIDLICLAGYMRLLPSQVVTAYRWRIMNVHPALLPRFAGKGMFGSAVHHAVIESGASESGCTVHFVDEEYDHGPIILQERVPVLRDDTPESLAARVLPVEHRTYTRAVRLFAQGRLKVQDGRVQVLDE